MRTTSTITSTLALLSMATVALGQSWNFATYRVADKQKITSYTGSMVAPPLPKAGTYYLWPGLQPADNSGIFQPVLDGRSGSWWFGMGWCCSNPSLPWGGGFGVDAGTVLGFNWTLSDSESTWKTTISNGKTGEMVDGEFPLGKLQASRGTKGIRHSPFCDLRSLSGQAVQPSRSCYRTLRGRMGFRSARIQGSQDRKYSYITFHPMVAMSSADVTLCGADVDHHRNRRLVVQQLSIQLRRCYRDQRLGSPERQG